MKMLMGVFAAVMVTTLVGCSPPPEGEGKAEHAGKTIDKAMEDAKSYTDEKVKDAGKALEEAGKDLQKDG